MERVEITKILSKRNYKGQAITHCEDRIGQEFVFIGDSRIDYCTIVNAKRVIDGLPSKYILEEV